MNPQAPSPLPLPQPFSFRLPANGQVDPWFGGTRTFWAERIRANGKPAEVHSFTIQQPGAKRGIRFIEFASALEYMQRAASGEKRPDSR